MLKEQIPCQVLQYIPREVQNISKAEPGHRDAYAFSIADHKRLLNDRVYCRIRLVRLFLRLCVYSEDGCA